VKKILKQKVWFSPKASKKLKSLNRIFKKLLSVHQDYIDGEDVEDDCPYWFGERPHVGLLAAAVWLSGNTALEEYGIPKTKVRKRKQGRCDLWIGTNLWAKIFFIRVCFWSSKR